MKRLRGPCARTNRCVSMPTRRRLRVPASLHPELGADYKPDPHIQRDYERARKHKWYMTARMITCNDIYSFDPTVNVSIDDFITSSRSTFVSRRGLGFDDSSSAHMWRTINMRPGCSDGNGGNDRDTTRGRRHVRGAPRFARAQAGAGDHRRFIDLRVTAV